MTDNMTNTDLSRRRMIATGLGLVSANSLPAQTAAATLTAGEVIARIKKNVGIPWMEQTVDNLIAGSADTPVKGIATTMMATLDVMQRAAGAGRNMVVTHESTFYSHQDTLDQLKNDPVYLYKTDFIRKNGMVSFHFHDHWHRRSPDGIAFGMARELGWDKYADPNNPRLFTLPQIPLGKLVKDMQAKFNIRTMRVVGDPQLPVARVNASWGYVGQFPGINLAARADTDLFVCGETREWELVEYVQDMIASGRKKAMIVMGHVVSEQSGMKYCAEWLKTFIPEVPIDFIPAAEPFWSTDPSR
jgi:putative NIF3 family GTP cyclohydrolase 1 type 2